jgi:flagellar basal-body rod modification protein FlgD
MNVNAMASHAASSDTARTSNAASDANDMFMKLLMAQLKNQSPLDPVDPDQFVGQLVQFNSLDQLIQIRETLQEIDSTSASSSTTSTQGAH